MNQSGFYVPEQFPGSEHDGIGPASDCENASRMLRVRCLKTQQSI